MIITSCLRQGALACEDICSSCPKRRTPGLTILLSEVTVGTVILMAAPADDSDNDEDDDEDDDDDDDDEVAATVGTVTTAAAAATAAVLPTINGVSLLIGDGTLGGGGGVSGGIDVFVGLAILIGVTASIFSEGDLTGVAGLGVSILLSSFSDILVIPSLVSSSSAEPCAWL